MNVSIASYQFNAKDGISIISYVEAHLKWS